MPADWMLAFDASAPRSCVALGRIAGELDELRFEDENEDGANQTSERLHERIADVLARAGITARELGWIACGRGPGTFTGTRVAVALAKGLGIGLGRPIIGVSTLAALACSAEHEGRVLALLDARREQVYGALFDRSAGGIASSEERVIELRELIADLGDLADVVAFGPGCGPYADHLPEGMPATIVGGPSARGLWQASVAAWRVGPHGDAATLEVCYLRRSYAEMGVHVPKRAVFKSPWV